MLTLHAVPADPKHTARMLLLAIEGEDAGIVERIAGAAAAGEALYVLLTYQPPRDEYEHGQFWTAISFNHGPKIGEVRGLPLVLPKGRVGVAFEPEVINRTCEGVTRGARLRVVGAHLEPRKPSYIGGGDRRSGVVLLACEGPAFEPWRRPRSPEMPRGTQLVYADGKILGRATVEGGAAQAARSGHLGGAVAQHGWRLADTPAGRFWMPRAPDDVQHRMREVRRELEEITARVDELARLDLSGAPDGARLLVDVLAELGRGGKADAIAAAAGIPAPRRAPSATGPRTSGSAKTSG